MVPDAEVLSVACEILSSLPIGKFQVKLNHRRQGETRYVNNRRKCLLEWRTAGLCFSRRLEFILRLSCEANGRDGAVVDRTMLTLKKQVESV